MMMVYLADFTLYLCMFIRPVADHLIIILGTAGHPEHSAHCLDAELSLMFFNKDRLHFRRFAKYVTAFAG
ncbi:TPA: hypothetical protein HNO27_24465 [Escherichia coli]|nr:hypothetical protein [Escherichia coli]HAJ7257735.1 hypothetical protein [Escherichia coli]HAJ7262555.1 hypothetical protein [Escherichia coli]